MITPFIILTILVLAYLCYPIRQIPIDFDEKDEAISIYRQEVTYIENQHYKALIDEETKTQLLSELDRKSAINMLAIKEKTFAYRGRFFSPLLCIIAVLTSASIYAHFNEKNGIGNYWQTEKEQRSVVINGLFDESHVRNFVAKHDKEQSRTYCFLMQKKLLERYSRNVNGLSNVAQCHFSQGSTTLAQTVITEALRINPNHAPSIYVLAELEFLQRQQLSEMTQIKLVEVAKRNPSSVDIIYLLMLNAYAKGDFKQAKTYTTQLREFVTDYPNLLDSLNAIEPQIDSQLYMSRSRQ